MNSTAERLTRFDSTGIPLVGGVISDVHNKTPSELAESVNVIANAGLDAVICVGEKHHSQPVLTAINEARRRELLVFVDPNALEVASPKQAIEIDGFSLGEGEILNTRLQRRAAHFGHTILLWCAGARQLEIREAVRCLRNNGAERIILVHGFSTVAAEDTNIRRMTALSSQFRCPVGYRCTFGEAERSRADSIRMAMATPSSILVAGPEADSNDLKALMETVTRTAITLGRQPFQIGARETAHRADVGKRLVVARDFQEGERIGENDIAFETVVTTAHSLTFQEVVGRELQTPLTRGSLLRAQHFKRRAVGLVSARLGSRRLPGKALLPLAGRPALEHLIERITKAKRLDRVLLCTSTAPENDALEELANRMDIGCFRGSEDDVLERYATAAAQEQADVVVRATGDDVLTDPTVLDAAIEHHLSQNADYTDYPGLPKGMETEVISATALAQAHELASSREFAEHLTYFVRRPDVFRISRMPVAESHQRPYSITLDTRQDYQRLEEIFNSLYRQGHVFSSQEVIDFLDQHPDLQETVTAVDADPVLVSFRINA